MTTDIDIEQLIENITPTKNLLSFSSHVVHGKVGNRAIQFPMNIRNWNIDCINTTNFSNHPGYKTFKGTKTKSELVDDIYEGLVNLKMKYDAIIVGYVASRDNLEVVYSILKNLDYSTIVVMDPILGDNGKLYVSQDIIPIYEKLLKENNTLVDVLTPNQFEIETLTDTKITCIADLKNTVKVFHELYNVKNIVITSVSFHGDDGMYCVGSSGKDSVFYFRVNEINAIYSGSGDLFLGILTDCFTKYDCDLIKSLNETIIIVEQVLKLTYEVVSKEPLEIQRFIGDKLYLPDLKLIESKSILMQSINLKNDNYEFGPVFL